MARATVIVRAFIISLSQTSGCVGWVAHRLLVSCSVLGVAVKPVLLTYLRGYREVAPMHCHDEFAPPGESGTLTGALTESPPSEV